MELTEALEKVGNVGVYLLREGPVFEDGDTFGYSATDKTTRAHHHLASVGRHDHARGEVTGRRRGSLVGGVRGRGQWIPGPSWYTMTRCPARLRRGSSCRCAPTPPAPSASVGRPDRRSRRSDGPSRSRSWSGWGCRSPRDSSPSPSSSVGYARGVSADRRGTERRA